MSKTITERMYEALPEMQDQKRISAELRKHKRAANVSSTKYQEQAEQQVKDQMLELITSGQEVPDDIAHPILEARARDQLFDLRAQTLSRLARSVENEEHSAIARNAEDLTAFLRSELERVVSEVRAATPDLTGITTAEQAIAAGGDVVTAWQRVTTCAAEYDEIRKLQLDMCSSSAERLTTDEFLRTGILADAIDVQGYWVDRRRHSASAPENGGLSTGGNRGQLYRHWLTDALPERPFDYNGTWWPAGESKVEHLMRLVSTATPWLPSLQDMRTAEGYAVTATAQVTVDQPDQMEIARRAYFELTGARPKVKLPEAPTFVRNTAPYSQPSKLSRKISDAKERSFSKNERRALGLGETHD